ncbi:hypothetical protein WA026_017868 [Henosepilachna vigintioctopunctata]|uniref:RNase H type-1 domain-containing protein n=1 Tax=Henosepilachna vigintioctopunctata TaxID=420089 RepID=A0AAW1TQ00_9CUCU
MKSTPICVLLSETGEIPLHFRAKLLGIKFILQLCSKNSSTYSDLYNLSIMNLTTSFWKNRKCFPLADYMLEIKDAWPSIITSNVHPNFSTNYWSLFPRFETNLDPPFNHYEEPEIEYQFNAFIHRNFENHRKIYTDGSVINGQAGCAIYDSKVSHEITYKLPDLFSTYTCEKIAVIEAIKYANRVQDQNFVIISDCRSVIQKISNFKFTSANSHILIEAMKQLSIAQELKKTLLYYGSDHTKELEATRSLTV